MFIHKQNIILVRVSSLRWNLRQNQSISIIVHLELIFGYITSELAKNIPNHLKTALEAN